MRNATDRKTASPRKPAAKRAPPRKCEVAVIGAGTAGLVAYRSAVRAGARVLLIESGAPGTTCARVGCMPSKLLIAAGEAAYVAATAGIFGVGIGTLAIDGRAVMARVQRERDRFVGFAVRSFEAIPQECRLQGHARFVGPNTLAVGDGLRVQAKAIVIATGSSAGVPKDYEHLRELLLTNENLFELETLPSSVAVIGAGPIGLELGQALQRLGVRTTLFDRGSRIAGLRDPRVADAAAKIFGESLNLRLDAQLEIDRLPQGARVRWRNGDGGGVETFERVFVAAGRPPNLAGLDLHKAGLALDEHGTPEFDRRTLRCGDSAVFIAGDANHDRPLLHEAADEGAIAGSNAATYPKVKRQPRRVPLAIVFSDPQIAMIGAPLRTGTAVGEVDYADQGRARVLNRNAGLLRLYSDAGSGILTGAEMVGPAAEHTAHLLAWAVQRKLGASDLLKLPFYHPTLEEGLRTALRDLCASMRSKPPYRREELQYGPGD